MTTRGPHDVVPESPASGLVLPMLRRCGRPAASCTLANAIQAEQATRAPHRGPSSLSSSGRCCGCVMLWEHCRKPSGSPAIPHVSETCGQVLGGLDILYTALGYVALWTLCGTDFTLLTLEGRPAGCENSRGKLVLLNFWPHGAPLPA